MMAAKLHLGCGENHLDEFVNVDREPECVPDELADLNEPWPWQAGSVEYILAEHVFEHLEDLEHAFGEAARVLEPGGRLEIAVPVGLDARTDPTHRHEFTYGTLEFYSEDGPAWGPRQPLELVERDLDVWIHGPMHRLERFAKWYARTNPYGACGLPCMSGELRGVYERV